MHESYPARYRDKNGEETATLHNDGKLLTISLRGVTFVGGEFDILEAMIPFDSPALSAFTLNKGVLCSCEIEFDMPIPVVAPEGAAWSSLHIHIKLGEPLPNGAIESETVKLGLTYGGEAVYSRGKQGFFEDELRELQAALPDGVYLKCCFSCAFSDYNPIGSGLFGDMVCFRDNKEAYLQVQDKYDLFRIWETRTGYVQETYLCSEFERRVPGAGYRG